MKQLDLKWQIIKSYFQIVHFKSNEKSKLCRSSFQDSADTFMWAGIAQLV